MPEEKSFSEILLSNLQELMKAKNAAHESIFKLHWKKMWPFNLIWPQVDFIRIVHLMEEISLQCEKQKQFIRDNLQKLTEEERRFADTVPAYLDALSYASQKLGEVSQFKQGVLEKKQKRDVFLFNKLLKSYEEAQESLVRAGAFVRFSLGELRRGKED